MKRQTVVPAHNRTATAIAILAILLLLLGALITFLESFPSSQTGKKAANGPWVNLANWIEPSGPQPDFDALIDLITPDIGANPLFLTPAQFEQCRYLFDPEVFSRWEPIVAATSDPEERYQIYQHRWGDSTQPGPQAVA